MGGRAPGRFGDRALQRGLVMRGEENRTRHVVPEAAVVLQALPGTPREPLHAIRPVGGLAEEPEGLRPLIREIAGQA